MRGSSLKLTLDREDLGVSKQDSTADIFSTIVDVHVPAGVTYVLLNYAPFVIKLADTENAALGRNGSMLVGFMGAGDNLVKELYHWDYGIFYDLTIPEQRNRNYRDQIGLRMEWPYVIVREDEHLVLQVKHATVVDISQMSNIIEFSVNKVVMP